MPKHYQLQDTIYFLVEIELLLEIRSELFSILFLKKLFRDFPFYLFQSIFSDLSLEVSESINLIP